MAIAPALFAVGTGSQFAQKQQLFKNENTVSPTYFTVPQNDLKTEIAQADSLLFDAFNRQDLQTTKEMFAPDLEFFHDKDGLGLYQKTIDNFAALYNRNKATALKRELVPGTMEVYPIKGYGALEIGEHRFCHFENGAQDCAVFKFAIIWRKTDNKWQASRVVSYAHVGRVTDVNDTLYKKALDLDKNLFDAFNNQQLDGLKAAFAPDLEFYQDDEGLENYDQTINDFKNMFAGNAGNNIHRDLVSGSVEVYPIPGYGILETGSHKFTHNENGQPVSGTFKFINLWHQKDGQWKLSRTISYEH